MKKVEIKILRENSTKNNQSKSNPTISKINISPPPSAKIREKLKQI